MKLGDLVVYLEDSWVVTGYDPKRTRTALLLAADGRTSEVPYNLDAVRVLANPGQQWPWIMVPTRPGYTIESISFRGIVIPPITGWVASDPSRAGGPVFLAPNPNLRYGECLLIHYRGVGSAKFVVRRLNIPVDFGTVPQRKARQESLRQKPPEPMNAFSRLLTDKQIGDEDD